MFNHYFAEPEPPEDYDYDYEFYDSFHAVEHVLLRHWCLVRAGCRTSRATNMALMRTQVLGSDCQTLENILEGTATQ